MIRSYPDNKDAATFSADTTDVERFAQARSYQCSRLDAFICPGMLYGK
jgi:hypothetical protein